MLTRKHFVELSRAFRATPHRSERERALSLLLLCNVLAQTNPAFDRVRFVAACQ